MARIPRIAPDFTFELEAQAQGARCVLGVDEVGRGPLCGPVTAAAVWLDPAHIPAGLADSKTLSLAKREAIAAEIHRSAKVCIAHASVEEIDQINILRASHLAMTRAVAGLRAELDADFALIDGNLIPKDMPIPARAIVKGDAKSLSIAAASIVAKVARDQIMQELAEKYPGYGWESNAGYPTKSHLEALLTLGITPVHRRSFKPIHNMLYQVENLTS